MKNKILSMALAFAFLFALISPVYAEGTAYTITIVYGNQECVLDLVGEMPITETTTIGEIKSEFFEAVKAEVLYNYESTQFWYGIPLTDETASLGDYNIPNGAKLNVNSVGAEIALNANMKLKKRKQDVYKVDITWGSMEFTYTPEITWDPVTHTVYSGHGDDCWSCQEGANEISVTNHSSAAVNIGIQYEKDYESPIDGKFIVNGNNTNQASISVDLAAARMLEVQSFTAMLELEGKLDSATTENTIIGNIIITVFSQY